MRLVVSNLQQAYMRNILQDTLSLPPTPYFEQNYLFENWNKLNQLLLVLENVYAADKWVIISWYIEPFPIMTCHK